MVDIERQEKEYPQTAEPITNYFIGRVQKDFKKGNTIFGGMFTSANRNINETHLNFLSREAYTGGIDFRHHWKEKHIILMLKLFSVISKVMKMLF